MLPTCSTALTKLYKYKVYPDINKGHEEQEHGDVRECVRVSDGILGGCVLTKSALWKEN